MNISLIDINNADKTSNARNIGNAGPGNIIFTGNIRKNVKENTTYSVLLGNKGLKRQKEI